MAIETKINKDKPKSKTEIYPKLMISEDDEVVLVVLFTSFENGIAIYSNDKDIKQKLYKYESYWDMSCFEDFDGEVTLRNK